MVICYLYIVNRHSGTLFHIHPVGLHFWMDSIIVCIISHLHNYYLLSCLCYLNILLLICKLMSFLPHEAKAMLGSIVSSVEHDWLK